MKNINILICEDELKIRLLVEKYLKNEGYYVFSAKNGLEGLDILEENPIDLAILDVMMPEYDGWSLLKRIREDYGDMPVIMLTARDEERDKIFGFELGADDYVAKPFSVKELMARVKSLLKRSGKKNAEDRIDIGNLQINLNSHLVFINDDEIPLTSKEYDLLIYFINNQNIALSREQIIDRVWGYDYYGDFRTVDTHIKRLRVKINDADVKIATVRNVGYRFEVN